MKPTYEELTVQLANAESKCRELAADNASLKNPENWLLQSDYGYEASEVATQNGATEDESLRAGMIAIINRIGTPATDDFLAEVRAQGVESLSDAVKSVIAERQRQQSVEGWTTARDDEYEHGELADAAGCYALSSELFDCVGEPPRQWPWPNEWWKPSMRRRDLVKAGALILAEIERLDRHELSSIQKGVQS
ncbi:hypothetical protein [Citrobacter freundii]|uniref:hypothetical protein n=1 Tax=Citrobacter freundii TaxID=546 RepID=UPI00334723BE